MRTAITLLCCLLVLPAWGEETTVYKRTRPDGTIEFSDTPFPGSKAIQVPPVPSYKAPPVPKAGSAKSSEERSVEFSYKAVRVSSPTEESTVFFDEQGTPVSVTVDPGLREGDVVTLYLDGQRVASGPTTSFTLKNVFRGSHTLSAAVEGPNRKELLRSAPVAFNMIQHTKH